MPCSHAWITEAADGLPLSIKTSAIEQANTRIIQFPDFRQHLDGMAKDTVIPGFIEKTPHGDAGVVAVPPDDPKKRPVKHLRTRRLTADLRQHPPARHGLLHDHHPEFVRQIELATWRGKRQIAQRIEAHRLRVKDVFAEHLAIAGRMHLHRSGPDGVRAAQENAPTVESEIAILEPEVAEPDPVGLLVDRTRRPDPRREPSLGTAPDRPAPTADAVPPGACRLTLCPRSKPPVPERSRQSGFRQPRALRKEPAVRGSFPLRHCGYWHVL